MAVCERPTFALTLVLLGVALIGYLAPAARSAPANDLCDQATVIASLPGWGSLL